MIKNKRKKKLFWILAIVFLITINFIPPVLSDFKLPEEGGAMVHSDPQMSENIRLPIPTENVGELWRQNDLKGEIFGTIGNGIAGNGKIAAATYNHPGLFNEEGGEDNLVLYNYYGERLWSSGKGEDWSLNFIACVSSPMVDIDNRVVACDNEKIIMINASNLSNIEMEWRTNITEINNEKPKPFSPTIVENETIILPTSYGPVFAYDPETGKGARADKS